MTIYLAADVSLVLELNFSVKQIFDRNQNRFKPLHGRAPSGPVSICNRDNDKGDDQNNIAAPYAVFITDD